MNFISHQYCSSEPGNPWFTVGNCLPDMLKFTGRRVPGSHSSDALADLNHPDERIQSVVRGILHHIHCDSIFHTSDYFEDLNQRLLREVSRRSLEIPRRDLFCHVLVEIAIDSLLNKEEPRLVRELYQAFERVDCRYVLQELPFPYNIDPQAVSEQVDNFMARGYLDSYGTPEGIFYVFCRLYNRLFEKDLLPFKQNIMKAIEIVFPLLGDYRMFLDGLVLG